MRPYAFSDAVCVSYRRVRRWVRAPPPRPVNSPSSFQSVEADCWIRSLFHYRYTGKLWLNEIWFWLLDALVLLLAMSVYLVVWPPHYLPHDSIVRGVKSGLHGLDDGHNMTEKDRRGWFGSKKRVNSDV